MTKTCTVCLTPAMIAMASPQSRLRILARFKLQGQKERGSFVGLIPLTHVEANARLTALVAFLSEEFIDLVRRVLLLAREVGVLGQQFICPSSIRTEHRRWLGLSEPLGLDWPVLNRLSDGFAGMPLLAGDLPLAFPFEVVGPANAFVFFHGNHLQFSYR